MVGSLRATPLPKQLCFRLSVGPFGSALIFDLGFDDATSTLYGSDAASRDLTRIDTLTGAGTLVGPPSYAVRSLSEPIP